MTDIKDTREEFFQAFQNDSIEELIKEAAEFDVIDVNSTMPKEEVIEKMWESYHDKTEEYQKKKDILGELDKAKKAEMAEQAEKAGDHIKSAFTQYPEIFRQNLSYIASLLPEINVIPRSGFVIFERSGLRLFNVDKSKEFRILFRKEFAKILEQKKDIPGFLLYDEKEAKQRHIGDLRGFYRGINKDFVRDLVFLVYQEAEKILAEKK